MKFSAIALSGLRGSAGQGGRSGMAKRRHPPYGGVLFRKRRGSCLSFFLATLTLLGIMAWLGAAQAWAHRDRGPNDPCRKEVGAGLLHMTLYQTQVDPVGEYCEEVPRAGKALMVVDVTPGELREVPISLEVVETDEAGQTQTVLSVPAKIYERGVLNTEVVFQEENNYVARVMLELGQESSSDQTSRSFVFPIQVAAWYKAMMIPGLIVAGIFLFILISVLRYTIVSRQQDEALA